MSDNNSSDDDETNRASQQMQKGLRETNQKVEASLLTAIQDHVKNHSKKSGVDFLDVKNSLLLSYLIDLTVYLKAKMTGAPPSNLHRLREMKVVLDKLRGLDKKLRYQIDKLLQAETAATYVTSAAEQDDDEEKEDTHQSDDPLQYRPNPKAFDDDDDDSSGNSEDEGDKDSDNSDDDDDDDLEAAKRTLAMTKKSKSDNKKHDNDDDGIYKAPRMTAMPYMLDKQDKEAARQKRERRRLRTSELAQSLRQQYGDAPEQEDLHGGTSVLVGKEAMAAKKFAKFQEEKTQFEEDAMIRLTVTKKEKKERKRIERMEANNWTGIADLGNLAREASRVIGDDGDDANNHSDNDDRNKKSFRGSTDRHANGKRKKNVMDQEGRPMKNMGRKQQGKAKNAYQAALFGGGGDGGNKKKKSKR
ncbi:Inherit from NOG: Neuroguidin, EIF4E binding protein [Seminavis robusta]|uniref:Inherit from NOG: Neuroguidin, EIF4E binding protein n=1 Tax=Seminavis robusta TaxID=568900 RepID=A0A9N8DI87_9STRA|nr:Inherit from NOG: Neuroguidin, EIF4E binding protein [Seminavis robusta]|eukprot:Sro98_g050440.1 Inherit from NOG: Neuroguidin, EIF4E binding protein (416) ;mRNA; r:50752-51999